MAHASVKIDSGPITATDLLRHVPRERWYDLMLARRSFAEINVSYDCRCLVQFVNDAKQMFKALEFDSVEDMIRDGYGLQPEEVAIAVRWLELNPPTEPVPMETAVKLGRHGGDRRSDKFQGGNATLKPEQKNTVTHILGRLDNERPELAAKVRAGELSANAAAIEAGFRKKLTPFEQVERLIPKLSAAEKRKVQEMLGRCLK